MYIIGSKDNCIEYKKLLNEKDLIVCMNFGLIMVGDWKLKNKIKLILNCSCNWLIYTFNQHNLIVDNEMLKKWVAYQMYAYKYIVINNERTIKLLNSYKTYKDNITPITFKKHLSIPNCSRELVGIDETDEIKKFLRNLGYDMVAKKQLFVGTMSVLNELMKKIRTNSKEDINLLGFTLNNKYNICSFYHERREEKNGHDRNVDIDILLWLHNNNYIDATLCFFSFVNQIPTLDMENIIKPTEKMLQLLKKTYDNLVIKF